MIALYRRRSALMRVVLRANARRLAAALRRTGNLP